MDGQSEVKFKEIVFEKIPAEIFYAHEAMGIASLIGGYGEQLNPLPCSQTFAAIQHHATATVVLCVAKLYEPFNPSYPNFSIPTALRKLDDIWQGGLKIPGRNLPRIAKFIQDEICASFDVVDSSQAPRLLLDYFKNLCPDLKRRPPSDLDEAFDAIRVLRDKRVAHREDHDLVGLRQADLLAICKLLAFAQTFINVMGFGLFGFSAKMATAVNVFFPAKSSAWTGTEQIVKAYLLTAKRSEASP